MAVADEHIGLTVACPHCQGKVHTSAATAAPQPPIAGVPPTQVPRRGQPVSPRSKAVAGLLGVMFGSFGVHRFYLGFIGIGFLQIAVTVMTCGVGGLWGLIEGILCLTGDMRDVEGRPLRE